MQVVRHTSEQQLLRTRRRMSNPSGSCTRNTSRDRDSGRAALSCSRIVVSSLVVPLQGMPLALLRGEFLFCMQDLWGACALSCRMRLAAA